MLRALLTLGISLAVATSVLADPLSPSEGRQLGFVSLQNKTVSVDLKIVDEDSGLSLQAKREVKSGTTGIDMLKATVAVEVKEYAGLGVRVLKLCDVQPARGKYWALYVNGEYAEAGISGVKLDKETKIEWKTQK